MSNFFKFSKYHQAFFKKHGELVSYKKDQKIGSSPENSQWVFFLEKGIIKASFFVEDGTERILGYIIEGSTFTKTGSLFKKDSENLVYETISSTTLYRIPTGFFLEKLKTDHKLLDDYLKYVTRNNMYLIDRILYQGSKGTGLRFIKWLLFMENYYGKNNGKYSLITIPITQDDMANFLHTTRESINKTISGLVKQKIIKTEKKHIHILNLQRLQKLGKESLQN